MSTQPSDARQSTVTEFLPNLTSDPDPTEFPRPQWTRRRGGLDTPLDWVVGNDWYTPGQSQVVVSRSSNTPTGGKVLHDPAVTADKPLARCQHFEPRSGYRVVDPKVYPNARHCGRPDCTGEVR